MSAVIAEGFDDLSSFENDNGGLLLNRLYPSGATVANASTGGSSYKYRVAGRFHGYGMRLDFGGGWIYWALPSNLSELYCAVALSNVTGTSVGAVLQFQDAGSNQVEIRMSGAALQATRDGTLLGSAADVFPTNLWRWLSIRVVIHSSAGIVEVRDGAGAVLLNLTGQNTQNTANAHINRIRAERVGTNFNVSYDDLIVMDTADSPAGTPFKGHLTERAIWTGFANADGAQLDWAASAGDRYAAVDDNPKPDDDTTYIKALAPGAQYVAEFESPPAQVANVDGLMIGHRSRRDSTGARSVMPLLRSGGTLYDGAAATLDSSYKTIFPTLWETDPDTAAAIDPADIADMGMGVEVVS